MSTTFRKTAALVWTQDPSPVVLRKASPVAFASDVGLTLRNIQGYAFETVPPGMILRNIQGYAFEQAPLALPLSKTGDLALYDLINSNRKVSMTFSSSNTTLGTPTALAQPDANGHNTSVQLSALSNSGYSGSITFNYKRRPITDAISGSVSLGTIASDTTVVAMLPTINSKYGLNLTAQDVVDGPVKAGATYVTLTIAVGSWVFLPGSVVAAGIVQSLATATPVVDLLGFDNAAGVGPKPFTAALLHFDGNLNDASGLNWTANGGIATSTSTFKFGTAALLNNGTTGEFASAPDASSLHMTADYTVEFFLNPANVTTLQVLTMKGNGARLSLSGGQILAYDDSAGNQMAGGSISTGSWYHIALVKHNGTTTLYVGGNPVATSTAFGSFGDNSGALSIGAAPDGTSPMLASLDEYRLSNEARYTASFTPPAAPFVFD